MEAAGCYGRNCADDVAADAALLSRAVGAPVRVQLTREQEHLWEPKGAAQLMQIDGGLDADGCDRGLRLPDLVPVERRADAGAAADAHDRAGGAGLRDGRPHRGAAVRLRRTCASRSTTCRRSCARRGCAACRRCRIRSRTSRYIDELATAAGVDPVEFRLRHLKDPRAAELVRATAAARRLDRPHAAAAAGARSGDIAARARASPTRATCTASGRASARPGRRGWPTSRSTARPAKCTSAASWSATTPG